MDLIDIPFERFAVAPVPAWAKDWLLLAAGDLAAGDWNCMTVGWGAFGVMWGRPMAMIVVRPTRYTHGFTERHDSFTLTAFPANLRPALSYCGSSSGRDGDKAKACGITPVPARAVKAPAFAEAELVIECRKTYADPLKPGHFLADWIEASYPKKDYHTMYFGEIVAISGTPKYLAGGSGV
jgi:flavin reductase (DIM6/NTAB) family NADH-FMN oxidoreductase RutF